MIKIICINGAPGVGKDTAGRLLKEIYKVGSVRIKKFAEPLDQIARSMLGMPTAVYQDWREFKKEQVPSAWDCEVTLRRLLITISENFVKPCFGKTWFAKKLVEQIIEDENLYNQEVFVITDSGFQYEFDAFKECFKGEAVIKLIHMTRTGHTFEGDSRHEVSDGDATIHINNDGTIDELKQLLSVRFFS